MTLLSVSGRRRDRRGARRGHALPMLLSIAIGGAAIAAVSYLLWPTWTSSGGATDPSNLPISIGGTIFNVPTDSVRMKVQRHTGPQDRVDLSFTYPSLAPGERPHHVTADTVETEPQTIQVLFLSIAAHNGALAPDERERTIYPRYLAAGAARGNDGLTAQPFRDNSPYANEDLYVATAPALVARCTRDGETPGMCLSERRIDGADLTFRFPRSWLDDWRNVATAMDRLIAQMHKG